MGARAASPLQKVRRVVAWSAAALVVGALALVLIAYFRSTNACYEDDAGPVRSPMNAIVYCDYGPPEVLELRRVEKPVPGDDQVLVRVRAAAVNPLDWHYMRGEPLIARPSMGLRRPASIRLGVDFAGTVEAVGRNVTAFQPGDEVFGGRTGAFAEYVVVRADRGIVRKPANVTFEQAAAVPVAALTALQALRDQGHVQPSEKVLINGASGGVGTFAVQIAKWLGAEVTGVSSGRNVELVRSLGADRMIDYTKEDFTSGPERYDLIVDMVGNHSFGEIRGVLEPKGRYVMVGGPSGRWLAPLPRVAWLSVYSRFVDQEMRFFISELEKADLQLLADLMEEGKVTPVIDRRYGLEEIREAMAYLETGRARGKVILAVDSAASGASEAAAGSAR